MKKVSTFSLFNFQINAVNRILQFVLFIIPLFYFAISIDPILPQHTNDTVIYASSVAIIVKESNVFNGEIVEVRTPIEESVTRKLVVFNIKKPTANLRCFQEHINLASCFIGQQ